MGILATVSCASISSWAGDINPPSMIEIGAAPVSGLTQPIEALFRVNLVAGDQGYGRDFVILAKISADGTWNGQENSYIDMQFEALGWQSDMKDTYIGVTLVSGDIQRNVQIGNDLTARISFLGVRGSVGGDISRNASVYLKGAADLIGIGMTRRSFDKAQYSGAGSGFNGEFGIKFFDHVRIAVGQDVGFTGGGSQTSLVGYTCETYYDSYGYSYQDCYNDYETTYSKSGLTSKSYVDLVIDLTQNLKLFGQASYNVYAYDEQQSSDSYRGAGLIFGGMAYNF